MKILIDVPNVKDVKGFETHLDLLVGHFNDGEYNIEVEK